MHSDRDKMRTLTVSTIAITALLAQTVLSAPHGGLNFINYADNHLFKPPL